MAVQSCPLTRRVIALVESGATIDQAAQRCHLHPSSAYRRLLAANVRSTRSWTRLSAPEVQRIRTLIDSDHSRREVARVTGRGLGTVARVAMAAQRDPDDDAPRRVRSAVRCGGCGYLVTVQPCVICAARGR